MIKKFKSMIYGCKHHPNKVEIENLSDHYRRDIFTDEALELLKKEDFDNLIKVAKYADFGILTAIEAAFCLGHSSGQQDLKDKINKHFMKGDAE